MDSKPWYESTTLWGNAVGMLAMLAGVFGVDVLNDPTVQAQVVSAILVVFNVVNRFRTTTPIV